MRVLLIEPPKAVWDLMGDCISPPLGLAWIAAVLGREDGVQVSPAYDRVSNIVNSADGTRMVFAALKGDTVYRVELPWKDVSGVPKANEHSQ